MPAQCSQDLSQLQKGKSELVVRRIVSRPTHRSHARPRMLRAAASCAASPAAPRRLQTSALPATANTPSPSLLIRPLTPCMFSGPSQMSNAFISLDEITAAVSAADFAVPILCLDSFRPTPEELTPPGCYQSAGLQPGTISAFDETTLKGRRGSAVAFSAAPGELVPPARPSARSCASPFTSALAAKLRSGASLGEALHTLPFEVANVDGDQEAWVKFTGKATAALRPCPGAVARDVTALLTTSPANHAVAPKPPAQRPSFVAGALVRVLETPCGLASAGPLPPLPTFIASHNPALAILPFSRSPRRASATRSGWMLPQR